MKTTEEIKKEAKKLQRKFRRECRLTESSTSHRMVKAWRVPGTQEHGRDHMYSVIING